jgi:archaellum component FlaC
MNRSSDTHISSRDLPSFLDSDADPAAEVQAVTPRDNEATAHYEDAGSGELDIEEGCGTALPDRDNPYETPSAASKPTARRRNQFQSIPLAGSVGIMFGATLTLTGLVTAALPAATAALAVAIAPQTITLLGLAVFAIGTCQRQTSRVQQRLQALETGRNAADDELRNTLAQILQGQRGQDTHAGEIDDAQHLMLSLQRQDQKINNLTKAIKMYGKPLMEIAGQGTELASNITQVKTLIETASESSKESASRIEQIIRSDEGNADLGDLTAQIVKLQVSLAAMSQRIEDTEVRKSLGRVEDATTLLATQLETLQRGENVKAATTELQQSLSQATTGLKDGLEQMRQGNLTGLETSVKDIQRELSGLATAMSQVQAAVKNGAPVTPTATQTAATPTPAMAGKTTAPSAEMRNDAASTDTTADNTPAEGSNYTTGQRKSGGEGVLGAIAKLKSMKN